MLGIRPARRVRSSSGISRSRLSPATFPYPLAQVPVQRCIPRNWNPATPRRFIRKPWRNTKESTPKRRRIGTPRTNTSQLKKSGASEDKILDELFRAVPLDTAWPNNSYPKSVSPEEEAKFYQSMEPVYQLLEKASRMHNADWSYCMEYKGIATSLDHMQNTRGLARYLGGKADWEIRNGRYEDAVKTLRIGIAMGNHVAKANFPHSSACWSASRFRESCRSKS